MSSKKLRPIMRISDGMTGQAECKNTEFVLNWADGSSQRCLDTSYVGAQFTDIPKISTISTKTPKKFA